MYIARRNKHLILIITNSGCVDKAKDGPASGKDNDGSIQHSLNDYDVHTINRLIKSLHIADPESSRKALGLFADALKLHSQKQSSRAYGAWCRWKKHVSAQEGLCP